MSDGGSAIALMNDTNDAVGDAQEGCTMSDSESPWTHQRNEYSDTIPEDEEKTRAEIQTKIPMQLRLQATYRN